jgi:osmotically-inducible protein OsmY/sporulation protein YlmC with PRC-barrel domain
MMIEQTWEVKIGSPVLATDGNYGRLEQVILDPHHERVIALAVRKTGLVNPQTVVVPQAAVAAATADEVHLNMSREQAAALPAYRPDTGSAPSVFGLQAGWQVFCRNEPAGPVSLALLDSNGRVNGFVMHIGHMPGRNVIVPVDWVDKVEQHNAYLNVDRGALKDQPDYYPDDVIASEVNDALWADDMIRATDYHEIGISVHVGRVTLKGHTQTSGIKTRAEQAARSTPGVLGIENQLVVDDELVMEVAQALARNARTRGQLIRVYARHGVISLNGEVGSAEIRAAAEECAGLPRVRAVVNYLRAPGVAVDVEDQRVLQPARGCAVYASDMPIGHVERVIINPHNRRVTAMVVQGELPDLTSNQLDQLPINLPQQARRMVIPIRAIQLVTTSVSLNLTSLEAAHCLEFDPASYALPAAQWQPPYPYRWDDVLFEKEHHDEPEN